MVKTIYMSVVMLFNWTTTIRAPLRVVLRNLSTLPTKGRCGVHYFYKLIVVSCYHGKVWSCPV